MTKLNRAPTVKPVVFDSNFNKIENTENHDLTQESYTNGHTKFKITKCSEKQHPQNLQSTQITNSIPLNIERQLSSSMSSSTTNSPMKLVRTAFRRLRKKKKLGTEEELAPSDAESNTSKLSTRKQLFSYRAENDIFFLETGDF